ncbi:MAG: hypothetical protein ABIY70_22575 [Capsulimonas sp.]
MSKHLISIVDSADIRPYPLCPNRCSDFMTATSHTPLPKDLVVVVDL